PPAPPPAHPPHPAVGGEAVVGEAEHLPLAEAAEDGWVERGSEGSECRRFDDAQRPARVSTRVGEDLRPTPPASGRYRPWLVTDVHRPNRVAVRVDSFDCAVTPVR